ncbi:Bug family tripartite tricarboxylate transporter substrate binding protein [Paracraurococcus ruber]|uniref:Twin-arginine translocation pathway signal protein n=1 Tax=Paracraurococcus ruber TaxID=77675 RepID=A0ABS1CYZ0_9PROT|nr:tripartite tricarboxylate transporter substrate binding protein [Paracraurococcus ruber]MBK1659508.1 twin-arginine translocation pathway signal protein [Paracraurococcus ruber]TDG26676.1 tripartite tricarboxylate transporter substrate binding protein [Paracraurococcus ruber]
MHRRSLLAGLAAGLCLPSVLRAQSAWPDRPIRLIVPWPPGGSTDTIARIFQPRLAALLGQPVVIDNRGGASGSIGAIEAARAPADGSTWLFQYDNEATNQTLLRLPYRTLEAFAPVSLVASGPLALVAHQSTPWRSFQDVVAAAKAQPDTVSYASSGIGGLAHVATTLLQQQGGFSLVHVPYRGGGPALTDAIAGQVPLFMSNVVIISQHIRAGTLRPLGVTTGAPTRHVPGVAPFAAQGFPGFDAPTWWAFLGRAGTPEPVMRRMQEALAQALADPEVRGKIEEQGADVRATGAEEARQFLAGEIGRWGQVIRANNIRADS